MSSIRTQILAAAKARIDRSGKPSGLTVLSGLTATVSAKTLPAVILNPLTEDSRPIGSSSSKARQKDFALVFDVYVACGPDEDTDEALDASLSWVEDTLGADPKLGGLLVSSGDPKIEWAAAPGEQPYARARVKWPVSYLVNRSNAGAHA